MKGSGMKTGNRVRSQRRFIAVPYGVPADNRLGKQDLRVLLALMSWRFINKKDGDPDVVYPSRSALSRWTGYSPNQISRITTRLEKFGWLTKSGNGGKSRAARYRLNWTVPGSAAEALVEEIQGQNSDPGSEDSQRVPSSGPVDSAANGASGTSMPGGENDHPGVSESDSGECANRTPGSAQNAEGHRNNEVEGKKERKIEEISAREKLARTLVDFFLSSFRGLGLGVATDITAKEWAAWCEDLLALIDDGVSPNDIFQVIDWLLNENRERDHDGAKHPFVVHTPTDLRKKWSKLYEAAANDRGWVRTLEGTPEYVRVLNMRRYVEHLFGVPVDESEGGEYDEDEVHCTRLLDPRNKVPPHIAFCFCVERLFPEGVKLAPSYTAVVRENSGLSAALNRVFPDLCQARYEELRSIAGDIGSYQGAGDREGQEALDINWSGGADDPETHGGDEGQDDDDLEGDDDGDFEDDLDAEAREVGDNVT